MALVMGMVKRTIMCLMGSMIIRAGDGRHPGRGKGKEEEKESCRGVDGHRGLGVMCHGMSIQMYAPPRPRGGMISDMLLMRRRLGMRIMELDMGHDGEEMAYPNRADRYATQASSLHTGKGLYPENTETESEKRRDRNSASKTVGTVPEYTDVAIEVLRYLSRRWHCFLSPAPDHKRQEVDCHKHNTASVRLEECPLAGHKLGLDTSGSS